MTSPGESMPGRRPEPEVPGTMEIPFGRRRILDMLETKFVDSA